MCNENNIEESDKITENLRPIREITKNTMLS
jgi:hypothetical protein